MLLLEFCSIGTLESSLRETEKSKLLLRTKTKIRLENEIARGMCHLFDARVSIFCCYVGIKVIELWLRLGHRIRNKFEQNDVYSLFL